MTFILKTSIHIQASPKKIWAILNNFEAYPTWNPFIKSLAGKLAVGEKLVAKIAPVDAKAMTFKPTILTLEKQKQLTWLGKLFISGIFDGEHQFELVEQADGSTIFHQNEIFKGILVHFIKKQLNNNTKGGFIAMNAALKALAEK
ncbi:SRPBCC domain-containing protein [Putridiphycobacter roseus]|uniref:SRPBCC domain-containing protein n=1 Tax=Putridiphycobacter roseus TaxID=2219161 RepID=A0A2W1MYF1_9FLAO|nr:SRPBCC domain-containing protein [Putridiphycobacter roseus]PZE17209.1 SRPBCC domain-containing protein [Putridiphycobacter roseus]